MTKTERTQKLKASIQSSARQLDRAAITPLLDSKTMSCSIAERKAYALKNILDNMPLHLDAGETIMGTRTLYKTIKKVEESSPTAENEDLDALDDTDTTNTKSDDSTSDSENADEVIQVKSAIPNYINENDVKFFGDLNLEFATSARFTPNYALILTVGLDGILARLFNSKPTSKIQKDYKNAVLISYMGLRTLINRYQKFAVREAKVDKIETKRRIELMQMANTCQQIKHKPPRNFQEACQLYWFAHLVAMIDSGNKVNCGKLDEILGKYYKDNEKDQAILQALLKKFSKELDENEKNDYSKTMILTGSLEHINNPEENGANMLTLAILDSMANLELTYPTISMYINADNGERYFKKATKLSAKGINIIKYFNDFKFYNDLKANGISKEDAQKIDQDLLPHLVDEFYVIGKMDLVDILNKTLLEIGPIDENGQAYDFTGIMNEYKKKIKDEIAIEATNCFKIQTAVTNFATGTDKQLKDFLKDETISKQVVRPFMSPLPFVSGLYESCLDNAMDVTWYGEKAKVYSYILQNPVTAINTLGAIKMHVFDESTFTLQALKKAMVSNFKGEEKMRKVLSSTQYWGNNITEYDLLAKEVIEFANMVAMSIALPNGGKIYPYVNQDEPVLAGNNLSSTLDGRLEGTPVINSTLTQSSSQALLAIQPQYLMGNFFTLDTKVAKEICVDLIRAFFRLGGHKYIPNNLDIKQLREAQKKPEKYPNLMVYYNDTFVNFINQETSVQDDIINLVKNGMT